MTDAELRARRRQLIRQHHPDTGGDPATFIEVLRALESLRTPPDDARAGSGRPRRPGVARSPRGRARGGRAVRRRRQALNRFRTRIPRGVPGARRYATY